MFISLERLALYSCVADYLFTFNNIFSNSILDERDNGIDFMMFVNLLSTVHLA